jgi:c-di-GMP-binding flagellar brake protein YcgR
VAPAMSNLPGMPSCSLDTFENFPASHSTAKNVLKTYKNHQRRVVKDLIIISSCRKQVHVNNDSNAKHIRMSVEFIDHSRPKTRGTRK